MKLPTASELASTYMYGNMHFAAVGSWVGDQAVGDEFITRQVAEQLQISDNGVRSVLGRLVIMSMVTRFEAREWRGITRAVPYVRNNHPF